MFAKPVRCNLSDITREIGQRPGSREIVLCRKDWAITKEKGGLGDTEQLVLQ